MNRKRLIIIISIAVITTATVILINKNMQDKDFWVVGSYPMPVNERVKDGYKVIGKYKLWNPEPLPITLEDAGFIRAKLPEWLSEHYLEEKVDMDFVSMDNQDLIDRLHYVFTMFHTGGTIEADFYILQLQRNEKVIKIYIGKGIDTDPFTPPLTKKLIYPFYDEEWHSNINDSKPFKPGDFW